MLDKIYQTSIRYNLLQKGDKIITALSGGADSMALLFFLEHVAKEYALTLSAVHVNHGIRGEEARRDEEFVRKYCADRQLPLLVVHKDVPKIAKERKMTLEEAGRKVRQEAFEKARGHFAGEKIALGHHLNDHVETILFRLARGTGARGLSGIAPKSGALIRPLIECTRREIEEFCRENQISYVTDSTNADSAYMRNKIRHQLIPWMEENMNSQLLMAIASASRLVGEQEDYVEEEAKKALEQCADFADGEYRLKTEALQSYHPALQKAMLRLAIAQVGRGTKDISARHIADILSLAKKGTGKRISLPGNLRCETQYDCLVVGREKNSPALFSYLLPPEKRIFVKERGFFVSISYNAPLTEDNFKNLYTKAFKCDKIFSNISFRTRLNGDRIQLKSGTKKLKDYFIDHKIPVDQRDSQVLLAVGCEVLSAIGAIDSIRIGQGTQICYFQIWEDTNGEGRNSDTERRA